MYKKGSTTAIEEFNKIHKLIYSFIRSIHHSSFSNSDSNVDSKVAMTDHRTTANT